MAAESTSQICSFCFYFSLPLSLGPSIPLCAYGHGLETLEGASCPDLLWSGCCGDGIYGILAIRLLLVSSGEPNFLYLTTTGRTTGQPREIEIWFTRQRDKVYVISYLYDRAHWVRNIQKDPRVHFRVGEQRFDGQARILDSSRDLDLCGEVEQLSDAKYGWSEGLIVELAPQGRA